MKTSHRILKNDLWHSWLVEAIIPRLTNRWVGWGSFALVAIGLWADLIFTEFFVLKMERNRLAICIYPDKVPVYKTHIFLWLREGVHDIEFMLRPVSLFLWVMCMSAFVSYFLIVLFRISLKKFFALICDGFAP